jgi:hypothetical protein
MTSGSGGSHLSRQALQSSLDSAIRDVRDVVEKKLRDHLGHTRPLPLRVKGAPLR